MISSQPSNELQSINPYPWSSQLAWFAVLTRPRFEKKIARELLERGIESFLPLNRAKRQWSDRKQLVSLPLFSRYVFVHIPTSQEMRIAVLRTNGVSAFVGLRGIGASIPDSEIDAIRTLLDSSIPFSICPYLKIGQSVRIRGGCLDGISGVVTRINGDQSLVLSVELIQRSVALRLTGYDIEPI